LIILKNTPLNQIESNPNKIDEIYEKEIGPFYTTQKLCEIFI
jgi:hypothetical protein